MDGYTSFKEKESVIGLKILKICEWIFLAFLLGASGGLPTSSARALAPEKVCALHASRHERLKGIPRHLLASISKVESGRYDKATKEVIAWPWTINAEGKGFRYKTKYEAITAVKKLQSQGVKSIDVGCMQVNLHHHKKAFKTLEDAFDPRKNIDYAARFLSDLKENHKSWTQAVAHYHSATPKHHRPYRKKVYDTWRTERLNNPGHSAAEPYLHRASLRDRAQVRTQTRIRDQAQVRDQAQKKTVKLPHKTTGLDRRRRPRNKDWTSPMRKKTPLAHYQARAQSSLIRLKERRGRGKGSPQPQPGLVIENDSTSNLMPEKPSAERSPLPFSAKRYASVRARARKLLNVAQISSP